VADKSLERALLQVGFDDNSARLILDNKLIAEAVVTAAKNICDKFRAVTMEPQSNSGNRPYGGSLTKDSIHAAVLTIRKKGKKVTQNAVAEELKSGSSYISILFKSYPELKEAYLTARNASGAK